MKNPTVSTSKDSPSITVTYTVVVTELDCNSCTDSDQMVLTINENPDCTVTVDDSASDGIVEPGSTHTAWIAEPSALPATIKWTVEDSEGNNLIVGPHNEVTVTFQAPLEPTTIKIAVELLDGNGCECAFDPPLVVPGPDAPAGILKVLRYIPTLAGWGLIGLAALIAGVGTWAVRRRKRQ
ncbi:MAG: IPTL-CTERM sorting domain-containing protein [Deltaproteobacteria bacterium]|nr:IPTL-CTERM sorting domain-containing protein [Deltaproteobacteria bacterium]